MTSPKSKEQVVPEDVRKAFKWLFSSDTGMSSKAILGHMICGVSSGAWPSDPSDLGRCLRLLELFPDWKPRVYEMAQYGPVWASYAARWDDLVCAMRDEVGLDWSKGRSAPDTYQLMRQLREAARTPPKGGEE